MAELKSVTSGLGHKVHIAAVAVSPGLRGGKGWVALCGNSQRIGGSWEPSETESAPDCPECLAAAEQHGVKVGEAEPSKPKAAPVKEPAWFSSTLEFDPTHSEVRFGCSINKSFELDVRARWGL